MHVITRFDKGGSAENTFLTLRGLDKARYNLVLVTGTVSPTNPSVHPGDTETAAIAANFAAAAVAVVDAAVAAAKAVAASVLASAANS